MRLSAPSACRPFHHLKQRVCAWGLASSSLCSVVAACPQFKVINGIEVPCGRCAVCREKRHRQLADSCRLEVFRSSMSALVTLTFADDFLPADQAAFEALGRSVYRFMTLSAPRGVGARGVLLGDVSPVAHRPHFHFAVWWRGCAPDGLALERFISERWPYGFVQVKLGDQFVADYLVLHNLKLLRPAGSAFSPFMRRSRSIGRDVWLRTLTARPDVVSRVISETRDVPGLVQAMKDGRVVSRSSVPRRWKALARDLFDVPSDDPLRAAKQRERSLSSIGCSGEERELERARRRRTAEVVELRAEFRAKRRR